MATRKAGKKGSSKKGASKKGASKKGGSKKGAGKGGARKAGGAAAGLGGIDFSRIAFSQLLPRIRRQEWVMYGLPLFNVAATGNIAEMRRASQAARTHLNEVQASLARLDQAIRGGR